MNAESVTVEAEIAAWNKYSEKSTENLTTADSSCVKFSGKVLGKSRPLPRARSKPQTRSKMGYTA